MARLEVNYLMSDGRDKHLNLENFFNQSPEFYEAINNHGHQGNQYVDDRQWEYAQYSPEYEYDPRYHNIQARGGYYPKPAYPEMPMQRQNYQPMYPPMHGYSRGGYPLHHQQGYYPHHQSRPQQRRPMPNQRGRMQPRHPYMMNPNIGHHMQHQQFYDDHHYDPHNSHVDENQTQELTSMLNSLGLQLGTEDKDSNQTDEEGNFITKEIVLLETGQLKVFCKDANGQYFANEQVYGERILKAIVDKSGKHIAVN